MIFFYDESAQNNYLFSCLSLSAFFGVPLCGDVEVRYLPCLEVIKLKNAEVL